MENWVDIAEADSLGEGRCRTVEVRGRQYAVARVGEDFFAVDNACPHRGGALGAGTVEEGRIYCSLHGWAFDLGTGRCVDRPDRSVHSYPIRCRDGKLWMDLGGS